MIKRNYMREETLEDQEFSALRFALMPQFKSSRDMQKYQRHSYYNCQYQRRQRKDKNENNKTKKTTGCILLETN